VVKIQTSPTPDGANLQIQFFTDEGKYLGSVYVLPEKILANANGKSYLPSTIKEAFQLMRQEEKK
jgi:hypothetical protein